MKVIRQFSILFLLGVLLPAKGEGLEYLRAGQNQILYEAWPGLTKSHFKYGDGWSELPAEVKPLEEFSYLQRPESQFASRLSAMIRVPETGAYTFWVTSKGITRLYLSLTGKPADLKRVVDLTQDCNRNAWHKAYRQESKPIPLEKGSEIYLSALHFFWEGEKNHVSVGWSRDGGAVEMIRAQDCYIPWESWGAQSAAQPTVYGRSKEFIEITWPRVNYGLGITSFNVYRDGLLLATDVRRYRFLDDSVEPGGQYIYTVEAVDLLGRVSDPSPGLTVTVPSLSDIKAAGTGLTAGFYLPTPEQDRDLGVSPVVEASVDSTFFLKNRKADAIFLQGAVPSFTWYREQVIDVPDFTRRPMRMEGYVEVPYDGEWTFTLRFSDRVQLWINKYLLINGQFMSDNRFQKVGIYNWQARIYLKGGEKVPILLESSYRTVQLEWEHIMRKREPVPIQHLYPSDTLDTDSMTIISQSQSYTSPAHVEVQVGSNIEPLSCRVNGQARHAIRLDSYRYLVADDGTLGVRLTPDRPATVDYTMAIGDRTVTRKQQLSWTPVVLGKQAVSLQTLTIREGDELLFKDATTGRYCESVVLVTDGSPVPTPTHNGRLAFGTPGTVLVGHGPAANPELRIRVIPVLAVEPAVMYLQCSRYWKVPEPLRGLYVEPADYRMVEVSPCTVYNRLHHLTLTAPAIGPSHMLFRERAGSPVLAMVPTDSFYAWNNDFMFAKGHQLKPPWRLYYWRMRLSHFCPGAIVQMEAVTRNRMCENGGWQQRYTITNEGNNLCGAPIAYNGRGWGRFNLLYFQGTALISNYSPGVEP